MTEVITSIFRKYDIRGTVSGDNPQITPDLARLVGKALGTYLPQHFKTERMFVGRDNRPSSVGLQRALMEGVASTGLDVTDIGEVLTPTTYFASASYEGVGAGVMITGSHLDTRYNGIKMAYGPLALADQQIQDLLKIIQTDAFTTGDGEIATDYDMIHKHLAKIKSLVKMGRPMKIAMDAGNGLSGTYIPPLLRELGMEVECLYCESDGTYPNHLPNPEDPEMTVELEKLVVASGADIGLAFDGDSDRCGFIDNHGHHITADRLLAVLAQDLLSRLPGSSIVFDVKVSQALPDFIKKHGGVPVMWKTGHSLMKLKMHEIGSPLGGEVSGHLFTGENYYGFDDAPLIVLRALEIFSHSDKKVAEIFAEIPNLVATPEIVLSTPDNIKFAIIDEMRDIFEKEYEVFALDGARVSFENGWGLIRASNTQPAVTLRFEAYTAADLVKYMEIFKVLMDKHPEIDMSKFNEVMERFRAKA